MSTGTIDSTATEASPIHFKPSGEPANSNAFRPRSWDERVDVICAAAADRAYDAARAALKRGLTPANVLDVIALAVDDFTRTHPDTAFGFPAHRAKARRQRFDDLYHALRAGQVPRAVHRPVECLVEHAVGIGPLAMGWRPDLYLDMVRWLVAPEPTIPALLDLVVRAADYLVRWQASDDLGDSDNPEAPCSPEAAGAADAFIAMLFKAGAEISSAPATVARPTDRQIAFVVELLECAQPVVNGDHRLEGEAAASQDAVHTWLRALVPSEVYEQVLAEIDSCRTCHAPLELIAGNMVCPACQGSAKVTAPRQVATVPGVMPPTTHVARDEEIDRADCFAERAQQRASKAMADLLVANQHEIIPAIRKGRVPQTPMVLVDEGLRALAAMRVDFGEPAAHIECDPLAVLVAELRHGRVPPNLVRVIRAFAVTTAEAAEPDYDDGHTRRQSSYSLVWLCCELAEYAALVVEGGDLGPSDWTVKGVKLAGLIAIQLIRCRIDHALNEGHLDDTQRAEIARAADEFIAGLVQSSRKIKTRRRRPVSDTRKKSATKRKVRRAA